MDNPQFVTALAPPEDLERALWFGYRGDELLVVDGEPAVVPSGREPPVAAVRQQYLGALAGRPCFAAELGTANAPPGHRLAGLRFLYSRMPAELFDIAGLAYQIQHWDRRHQYCPQCRAALSLRATERAKRCDACAVDIFPPVTPATITLVHDDGRVLMTRQARFPPGMYGLVAGFVEPGETLETCVAREVLEETNLRVADVRYFGSQPWPFPHQVMIGFVARYAGGELKVDETELEEARWFERDSLPKLPPRISIARALIDHWLSGETAR